MIKKQWKDWEFRIKKNKDAFVQPFLKLLIKAGITPNFLSFSALIFGLGAAFAFGFSEKLFLIFIILNLLFDIIDGPLARYKNQDSDKGFWLDYSFDRIVSLAVMINIYLIQPKNDTIYLWAVLVYLVVHLIYARYRKSLILIYGHPIYYLLLVFNVLYASIFALVLDLLNILIFVIYLCFSFRKRHSIKRF